MRSKHSSVWTWAMQALDKPANLAYSTTSALTISFINSIVTLLRTRPSWWPNPPKSFHQQITARSLISPQLSVWRTHQAINSNNQWWTTITTWRAITSARALLFSIKWCNINKNRAFSPWLWTRMAKKQWLQSRCRRQMTKSPRWCQDNLYCRKNKISTCSKMNQYFIDIRNLSNRWQVSSKLVTIFDWNMNSEVNWLDLIIMKNLWA